MGSATLTACLASGLRSTHQWKIRFSADQDYENQDLSDDGGECDCDGDDGVGGGDGSGGGDDRGDGDDDDDSL